MTPRILLQTTRLRLREFTLQDVDHVAALDGDPNVMRYISFGEPTPREVIASKVVPAWIKQYASHQRVGFWAAELSSTAQFIGWFHLRPDRFAADEQELGYRLAHAYWGQGLATEGAMALIRDGFSQSNFEKISARALLGNLSSQRVMQKCGLAFEEKFIYPQHILRGGSEEERRAVKYSARREAWLERFAREP